jgi:hypothetical protein
VVVLGQHLHQLLFLPQQVDQAAVVVVNLLLLLGRLAHQAKVMLAAMETKVGDTEVVVAVHQP